MENFFKLMHDIISENSAKADKGFPVAALAFDENGKMIDQKVNARSIDKKTNYENHAEWQCLESSKIKNFSGNELHLIITLPPCSFCLEALKENAKIKSVTFLFDPVGKTRKTYIKTFGEFKICKVEESNQYIDLMWETFEDAMCQWTHKKSLKRILQMQNSNSLQRYL